MTTSRRLAAIVVTDVVGYSRLMGADEEGTRAAMRKLSDELWEPKVEQFGGRIVKTTGDGQLLEFPSVVEALKCAVDIQEAMAERNKVVPEEKRIVLRVGVNLGDVIVEGDDIHGDGVNVAARLEGLSDPGGVCISGPVYDQVKNKVELEFADLGPREVKNIAEPVRVYGVAVRSQTPAATLPLPDKPSIAVLPFENMSGDPEQEYFSDGISEDIITALSRVRQFFVIARNTTFLYKGRAVDVQTIARDLGVRYVLEGSVRRAANRVRITAQLIDGTNGNHLWADKYDRDLEDIFAVQDEITLTVVAAIEPELSRAERERAIRKPPNNLDAWDTYQRGLLHLWKSTKKDYETSVRLFERAVELDPTFCAAYAHFVFAHLETVLLGFAENREEAIEEMMVAAKKAISADDRDALSHWAFAGAHMVRGEHGPAIQALRKAIQINPSFAKAYHWLAYSYTLSQQADEAVASAEYAMRLNPHDPNMWANFLTIALAYFNAGKFEEAEGWARRSTQYSNSPPPTYATLLACLGQLERTSEAESVRNQLFKLFPEYDANTFARSSVLLRTAGKADFFSESLRKAALPE